MKADPLAHVATGLGAIQVIRHAASRFSQAGIGPAQTASWIEAALSAFSEDGEITSVVVGSADAPEALAALIRRRDPDRLEPISSAELYEPLDFLSASPAALQALARACAGLGVPVFLPRLPIESPTVLAMRRAYQRRGMVIVRPADSCLWVRLDSTWTKPERHLDANVRRNLARRRRRASEIGPIQYDLIHPTPAQLEDLLDEAFRIEAASWKGREGTALLQDSRRGQFFRAYAARAARDGDLRIGFLRFGDERVAMHLGIERDGCFWALKMGYDEQYSRLAPGRLIACEALRDSAERGLQRFEMLGVAEGWKREWTNLEHSCVSVRAYPLNPRSATLLMNDVVSWSWRHFIQRRMSRTPAQCSDEHSQGGRTGHA